jgi:SAM-dependent methyltransferase
VSAAFALAASPSSRALLGAVAAQSVAYAPERVAEAALALLAVQPDARVLELGCGSGRLLGQLAARVRRGFAVGIDPSEPMVRHARHRNRRWLALGRAAIERAASADLSIFPDASFDAVLGVHVVCFWTEPARDLAEVRRVLREGGRVLLGFRPDARRRAAGAPADPARVPPERVESWLRANGFGEVEIFVRGEPGRPLVFARGRRA